MATIKKEIDVNVNTKQGVKSLEELGGKFEDAYKGVLPLNTQIGELEDRLYQMAANGEAGSKKFIELTKEVGKMRKVIIDTDMAVDGMSQSLAQSVGGALQGVASGFELAQGAMSAFGAGGEAVEEALLKVQSAMAISQGIQGIRESITHFQALRKVVMSNVVVQKLLNFVMNLNPIGMIILAVAALGAAIYALWDPIKQLLQFFGLMGEEIESAEEKNKKLTKSIEAQTKATEALMKMNSKMHDNRMRELELSDASEEEKHQATLDRLKQQEKERLTLIDQNKKNYQKDKENYKQALKEGDSETAKSIKDRLQSEKDKIRELELNAKEYDISRREEEKRFTEFLRDEDEKQAEDDKKAKQEAAQRWREFQSNRLAEFRRIEDLRLELIDDTRKQQLEKQRISFERALQDLKANTETSLAAKQELELLLTEKYERERSDLIFNLQAEAAINRLETKSLELEAEFQLEESHLAKVFTIDEEAAKRKIQLEKDVQDSKVQIASDGFQLIANFAELFAGRSEKAAKMAFQVQKTASIAQATISGIEASINAFKTASGSPITAAFPAYPFIQAGLAAGFAATNIAKIASSKFQGGGTGSISSSGIGGGGGGLGASQPAQFNVVGDTGLNQIAESLGQKDDKPIKSYVVSGEVTSAQSLERNKIENSTL